MAYNQTWGESFSRPYREMSSAQSSNARAEQTAERTNLMPELMSIKQKIAQANLDRTKAMISDRSRAGSLRERQFESNNDFRNRQLEEKKREFDTIQANGGAGGARSSQGKIVKRQLPSGATGTFQNPNLKTTSALQKVQVSMPSLASSIDEIGQGVRLAVSAGGNLQKVLASIAAYGQGKATPAQDELLSKYRISKNAITQAGESMLSVLQLNSTEHNLKTTMDMFTPRKGETEVSFGAGLRQTFMDMKKRAVIADYIAQNGVPLDDVAKGDMKQYLRKEMSSNLYDSHFEGGGGQESDQELNADINQAVSDYTLPDGVTEDDVSQVMQKFPDLDRSKAVALIKKIKAKQGATA